MTSSSSAQGPLAVDINRWLSVGKTGFDAFPDARSGKMDAETCALLPVLQYPNGD
jgi:hypothetical protein